MLFKPFFFFLTGERRENKEMRQVEITSVKFLWGFLLGFFLLRFRVVF